MSYFHQLKYQPFSLDIYTADINFDQSANDFLYTNARGQVSFNQRHDFSIGEARPLPLGLDYYTATKGAIVGNQVDALLHLTVVQLNNGVGSIGSYDQLSALLQAQLNGNSTDYASYNNQHFSSNLQNNVVDAPVSITYGACDDFRSQYCSNFNYSLRTQHSKVASAIDVTNDKLIEETVTPYLPINNILFSPSVDKTVKVGKITQLFSWSSYITASFVLNSSVSGLVNYLTIALDTSSPTTRNAYVFKESFQQSASSNVLGVPYSVLPSTPDLGGATALSGVKQALTVTLNAGALKTSRNDITRTPGELYYRTGYIGSNSVRLQNVFNLAGNSVDVIYDEALNTATISSDFNGIYSNLLFFRQNLPIRGRNGGLMVSQPYYDSTIPGYNVGGGKLHALVATNGGAIPYYLDYLPYTSVAATHRLEVAVASPKTDPTNSNGYFYVLTNTTDGTAAIRVTQLSYNSSLSSWTEADLFTANATNITLGANVSTSINWLFGTRPSAGLVIWSDGNFVDNPNGYTIIDFPYYLEDTTLDSDRHFILRVNLDTQQAQILKGNYVNNEVAVNRVVNAILNNPVVYTDGNAVFQTDQNNGVTSNDLPNYILNGNAVASLPVSLPLKNVWQVGDNKYTAFDFLQNYYYAFIYNNDFSNLN